MTPPRWRPTSPTVIGDRAWVRTRDEAIAEGWFGPVDDRVRGRIGDVLVAGIGPFTLVDSRTARPQVLALIGQHGSLTGRSSWCRCCFTRADSSSVRRVSGRRASTRNGAGQSPSMPCREHTHSQSPRPGLAIQRSSHID